MISIGVSPASVAVLATRGGGSPAPAPELPAFAYQTDSTNYLNAASAAGAPLSTALGRQYDRMIRRLKGMNLYGSRCKFLNLPMPSEAQFMINIASPGTLNLRKVGTPTFLPNDGVTTTANTSYYENDWTLADANAVRDDHSYYILGQNNVSIGQIDGGATNASGTGITLICQASAGALSVRSMTTTGTTGSGNNTVWGTPGWYGYDRTNGTQVTLSHHSIAHNGPVSSASVSVATADKFRLLGAANQATFSPRKLGGHAFFSPGLSPYERTAFHAITTSFVYSVMYGCPYVEERGIGTTNITADVAVYGCSLASIAFAYEIKRLNPARTVVIIGDSQDWNIDDIGGMPANGLNFADCKNFTAISGIFREMVKWINTVFYLRTDTINQAGISAESRAWNFICRRMLDPTKTGGVLPGLDIPVYMTGGLQSVTKGTKTTAIKTRDERTVTASFFAYGDYEGEGVYLSGEPYITGSEPAGAGVEAGNGFRGLTSEMELFQAGAVTTLRPDPYVTPGTPASGFLPDIVPHPGLTEGTPEPALQSMNKRITISGYQPRRVRWDYFFRNGPPRNYNAQRYELFARYCAAATAAGVTMGLGADLVSAQQSYSGYVVWDWNDSSKGFSTDLPNSGLAFATAGLNYALREQIVDDYEDYVLGWFYFILYSGDARIPAGIVTSLQGYGFDVTNYLDPKEEGRYFLPERIYVRDPIWQLNGPFKHDGNDITLGTAGARSRNTATFAAYRYDQHDKRRVAYDDGSGMTVWRQGQVNGEQVNVPVAAESFIGTSPNSVYLCSASWSKPFHSNARMEFTYAGAAMFMAHAAHKALTDNVAIQDVDFAAVRTSVLAAPYTTPLYIPQPPA